MSRKSLLKAPSIRPEFVLEATALSTAKVRFCFAFLQAFPPWYGSAVYIVTPNLPGWGAGRGFTFSAYRD